MILSKKMMINENFCKKKQVIKFQIIVQYWVGIYCAMYCIDHDHGVLRFYLGSKNKSLDRVYYLYVW